MTNSISPPGTEIEQEFTAATSTVVAPALPALIIGPLNQIVEAVDDTGALNSDAILALPARIAFGFVASVYTSAGGLVLGLRVNRAAEVTVTLPGTNPTPAEVVDAINDAEITGLSAIVELSGGQSRVVLLTTTTGEDSVLEIGSSTAAGLLTALSILKGSQAYGVSGYNNYEAVKIQASSYPDPRSLGSMMDIDYSTVRLFIADGAGSFIEAKTTEGYLRGATSAVTVVDDGDGDSTSPYLNFAGQDFSALGTRAAKTGSVTVTTIADIGGLVLRMAIDEGQFQTLVFTTGTTTGASAVTQINAIWGSGVAAINGSNQLTLTGAVYGEAGKIRIDSDATSATLLTTLGHTSTLAVGSPLRPFVGDEVWVDGLLLGQITEVPTTPVTRLRISVEQLLTFTGATWRIQAKGLNNTADPISVLSTTRPGSDLYIDTSSGTTRVRTGLFRSTDGTTYRVGPMPMYLGYTALRLDVTSANDSFTLVAVNSLTELEADYGPVNPDNPLAFGLYMAWLNSGGRTVYGVGVRDVSSTEVEGTLTAYGLGFEYLESKDVYTICPLSSSVDVGDLLEAHVTKMSAPSYRLERSGIVCHARPTRKLSTVVASSQKGNVAGSVGSPTDTVSTGIANLQALLAAAGKPGPSYTETDGVYLEFEGDTKKYLIQSVSGQNVVVNNGALSTTNDFYFDNANVAIFSAAIVDRPLTVKIRGAVLGNREDEAVAYAGQGTHFSERRIMVVAPDTVTITVDGLDTNLPGYYAGAAIAGLKSSLQPQEPLSGRTLVGIKAVPGIKRYSTPQLNIIAGGGVTIIEGDETAAKVGIRDSLTSDVTSLKTRSESITRAVDALAKIYRATFRAVNGSVNLTSSVYETVSLSIAAVNRSVQGKLMKKISVASLTQSSASGEDDTLEAEIEAEPFYPFNKLRIKIRI